VRRSVLAISEETRQQRGETQRSYFPVDIVPRQRAAACVHREHSAAPAFIVFTEQQKPRRNAYAPFPRTQRRCRKCPQHARAREGRPPARRQPAFALLPPAPPSAASEAARARQRCACAWQQEVGAVARRVSAVAAGRRRQRSSGAAQRVRAAGGSVAGRAAATGSVRPKYRH